MADGCLIVRRVAVVGGAEGHGLRRIPVVRGEREAGRLRRDVAVVAAHRDHHVARGLAVQDHRVGGTAGLVHRNRVGGGHRDAGPPVFTHLGGDGAGGDALSGVAMRSEAAAEHRVGQRTHGDQHRLLRLVVEVDEHPHRQGLGHLARREGQRKIIRPSAKRILTVVVTHNRRRLAGQSDRAGHRHRLAAGRAEGENEVHRRGLEAYVVLRRAGRVDLDSVEALSLSATLTLTEATAMPAPSAPLTE